MTDSQIIARILERGEVQLFSLIVGRYSAEVYRAAMATAHNTTIAEEATQQAFIKAYENLHRWRGGLSIAPYLKMIAHNTALTILNKASRSRTAPIEGVAVVEEEYDYHKEELLTQLTKAIRLLPMVDQRIVELFYWQKVSTAEIARLLVMSESNVLVRLHRIRQKLKTMIGYEAD